MMSAISSAPWKVGKDEGDHHVGDVGNDNEYGDVDYANHYVDDVGDDNDHDDDDDHDGDDHNHGDGNIVYNDFDDIIISQWCWAGWMDGVIQMQNTITLTLQIANNFRTTNTNWNFLTSLCWPQLEDYGAQCNMPDSLYTNITLRWKLYFYDDDFTPSTGTSQFRTLNFPMVKASSWAVRSGSN